MLILLSIKLQEIWLVLKISGLHKKVLQLLVIVSTYRLIGEGPKKRGPEKVDIPDE